MAAEWAALSQREKDRYGYEQELLTVLEKLVRDMNRKIERQKDRADKESAARELTPEDVTRLEGIKSRERELVERSEKVRCLWLCDMLMGVVWLVYGQFTSLA